MKKLKLVSLVLCLMLVLSACSSGSADSNEILIASANPMTGDSAQFGDMKVKAIQLAIEEYNVTGGINGKMIKLLEGDDTGNPKEAPSVAQKFASNDNVLAVIGHWNSSCTLAAREIYNSVNMPVITDSVNKTITDGTTPNIYRISLTDTTQANKLAEYAYNTLNKRKIAIMYTANDFGNGLKNDFTIKFEELGGEIVASEMYFEGQSKDFKPQLTKIKGQNPDMMFIAGYYVEAALISQQSRDMGLDADLLGTEGISSEELIKLGGKAVEGIKFTAFFHPEVEYSGTADFVKSFTETYDKEPDTYAALAYDSAKLILKAIEEKGEDRQAILDYIESVEAFPGVAGPIEFEDNNVTRNVIIATVKDGKIVLADEQPK